MQKNDGKEFTTKFGGVFGLIENATISNLILQNTNIKATNDSKDSFAYAGGIVGKAKSSTISNISIYSATINSSASREAFSGGILGFSKDCTLTGNFHIQDSSITSLNNYKYSKFGEKWSGFDEQPTQQYSDQSGNYSISSGFASGTFETTEEEPKFSKLNISAISRIESVCRYDYKDKSLDVRNYYPTGEKQLELEAHNVDGYTDYPGWFSGKTSSDYLQITKTNKRSKYSAQYLASEDIIKLSQTTTNLKYYYYTYSYKLDQQMKTMDCGLYGTTSTRTAKNGGGSYTVSGLGNYYMNSTDKWSGTWTIVPSINVKLVTGDDKIVKYWEVDNHSEYLIAYNNVENEPNELGLYVGGDGHIIKLYNKYLINDGIQYVS